MYHQINDNPTRDEVGIFVNEDNFKEQKVYLKENGYTLIDFDGRPNINNIDKPIIVTFDDGWEYNMLAYYVLAELADETFHPKATFFANGSNIDRGCYLTAA